MVQNTRRFSSSMKGVIEREDKARMTSAITRRVGKDPSIPGTSSNRGKRTPGYSQDDIGKSKSKPTRARKAPSKSPSPRSKPSRVVPKTEKTPAYKAPARKTYKSLAKKNKDRIGR